MVSEYFFSFSEMSLMTKSKSLLATVCESIGLSDVLQSQRDGSRACAVCGVDRDKSA